MLDPDLTWIKSSGSDRIVKKILFMYFQRSKLCGLSPNFHNHVSVSDLYIPTVGPPIFCSSIGRPIVGVYVHVNRSQKHDCRTWEWGCAVSFLEIFVSNFRYTSSAIAVRIRIHNTGTINIYFYFSGMYACTTVPFTIFPSPPSFYFFILPPEDRRSQPSLHCSFYRKLL